ncbi:MAG: glutathione S-transferase N-terminal domain-containing protein, partial [Acidimicrobiales bacterium]|nr:glutathione S-transferase N-terminal domain-containing protein [Acidimicrobiales bacterium]
KLYGFSVSNYYNMVKLALLEKGLPFEEVPFYAGQTPEVLAVSPRGKVPVLGVKQGFINETSVILEYLEQTQEGPALLPADPFAHLDPGAVAPLVAAATRAGRMARPDLEVGVCGEHGGDPESIRLLVEAGVDSVSCSPFRVPVARLAVAQALIASDD